MAIGLGLRHWMSPEQLAAYEAECAKIGRGPSAGKSDLAGRRVEVAAPTVPEQPQRRETIRPMPITTYATCAWCGDRKFSETSMIPKGWKVHHGYRLACPKSDCERKARRYDRDQRRPPPRYSR